MHRVLYRFRSIFYSNIFIVTVVQPVDLDEKTNNLNNKTLLDGGTFIAVKSEEGIPHVFVPCPLFLKPSISFWEIFLPHLVVSAMSRPMFFSSNLAVFVMLR